MFKVGRFDTSVLITIVIFVFLQIFLKSVLSEIEIPEYTIWQFPKGNLACNMKPRLRESWHS